MVPAHKACLIDSIIGREDSDGLLLLSDGSLKVVLRCDGINPIQLDSKQRDTLTNALARLAENSKVSIQLVASARHVSKEDDILRHQSLINTNNDYLEWCANYLDRWFHNECELRETPHREFYVVISYLPPKTTIVEQTWCGISIDLPAGALQQFNRHCNDIIDNLTRCKINPSRLSRTELQELIKRHNCILPEDNANEGSSIEIEPDSIQASANFAAVQYATSLPSLNFIDVLAGLLPVSIEHTLSLFFHPRNSHVESGNEIDLSVYLRTEAATQQALKEQTKTLAAALKKSGIVMTSDAGQTLELWHSSLPLGTDRFAAVHRVSPQTAGTFFPFFTGNSGHRSGAFFGFADCTNETVLINPFDRTSGMHGNNVLVAGHSAAMREFVTSLLAIRFLPMGMRFIILSDSFSSLSSFKFLADVTGDESSQCFFEEQCTINPFDLGYNFKPSTKQPPVEAVRAMLSFFDRILSDETSSELTVNEKALLNKQLQRAYEDAIGRNTVPTLTEFANLIHQSADEAPEFERNILNKLHCGLSLFTKSGAYSSMIDGQTNLEADKVLTAIDTSIRSERRHEEAISFALQEHIIREAEKAKSRCKRLAVIAHTSQGLLASGAGLRMLDNLAQHSQQYGMMLLVSTDRLAQICKRKSSGNILLNNTQTKVLLSQKQSDLPTLKSALNLTDSSIAALEGITSLNRDCRCLLITNSNTGVVSVTANKMEYWITTTEPVKDLPKRLAVLSETKQNYGMLSHSDACRKTVHLLSSE